MYDLKTDPYEEVNLAFDGYERTAAPRARIPPPEKEAGEGRKDPPPPAGKVAAITANSRAGASPGGGENHALSTSPLWWGQSRQREARAAWRLARAQHGVLTRGDLCGLGFATKASSIGVATGRLHLISRGVYAVGRRELTPARALDGGGACLRRRRRAQPPERGASSGGSATRSGTDRRDRAAKREIERTGLKVRSRPSLPSGASWCDSGSR